MRLPTLLLILMLFTANTTIAQRTYTVRSKKAIASYEKAISYYRSGQLDDAFVYLDNALKQEDQFVEVYLMKADIYNQMFEYNQEIDAYLKAYHIDSTYFPYLNYNIGLAYWNTGQYYKSKQFLSNFKHQKNVKPHTLAKAGKLLENCEFAISMVKNPVEFNPINLGDSINNENAQYWPSLSLDGQTLIYTTMEVDSTKLTRYGTYAHDEDFYVSYQVNNAWSKGQRISPPLNTSENEGAQKLSSDGKVMVYTGCNRNDGLGRCDIYFAYLGENGWSRPVNAGPSINTKFSEKQPMLSPDNRILYFSSNRPKGLGGMDIWFSRLQHDGQWSTPENMGELINTTMDDISPYIHADNKTLYYSSEGLQGMGMQDIFISKKDSLNEWSKPENIGYPINTFEDEFGLVIDNLGETAYFSSNKNGRNNNIYSFELPLNIRPNIVSYIQGKIFDNETKKPLHATFQLLNIANGDTLMESSSNIDDGSYLVCLPIGNNYALNVAYPGYLFHSQHFDLQIQTQFKPLLIDIPLQAIKVGEKVVLENIFFESNAYELNENSSVEIDKIEAFIRKNPKLKIEIGGHTDNTATESYNLDLSEKRAKAVFEAISLEESLLKNISYKGYGQSEPKASNEDDAGKALNRRTELKVIE